MAVVPVGVIFNNAVAQPLSTVGAIQPGAYYQFYLTGTTTLATVYADGSLSTPLSQTPGTGGTTLNSAGQVGPIYLDPGVIYRYQLYTSGGVLLKDVDPYLPSPLSYQTGSFTMGTTGFVSNPSGTAQWVKLFDRIVHLFPPILGPATSNSTSFTLTGLPAAIQIIDSAYGNAQAVVGATDNTVEVVAGLNLPPNSSIITMGRNGSSSGWTASGLKGFGLHVFTYFRQ